MRPLFHPAIEDVPLEAVLHALSDPVRVSIFADIASASCAMTCSNFLSVAHKPIPKSTLSQHFQILREAGLIRSQRQGVELHNVSRCEEINARFPGLVPAIIKAHQIEMQSKASAA
jgi:DNA-binding transcriptional ArsR family regulator